MSHVLTAPRSLKPGDTVALIAPAGSILVDRYEQGLAVLNNRYNVKVRDDIRTRYRYMAGSDRRRADELQQAIDDPQIKAIFAARGGYGCTRLLDRLNATALKRNPKWLVGYSDITALHAIWSLAGIQSIHGPNVHSLHQLDEPARQQYFATLEQPQPVAFEHLQTLRCGRASGPLIGGNLALIAALLATPGFPPIDDAVLLLEDVNEAPYRVDRLLTQCIHAGVFDRVAAVALGRFSQSQPDDDAATVQQVLSERMSQLPCPVVAGLPLGHDGCNIALRLGTEVHLTAEPAGARLRTCVKKRNRQVNAT